MTPLPIVDFAAVSPFGATAQDLWAGLDAGRTALSLGSASVDDATHPTGDVTVDLPALPGALASFDTRCNRLMARALADVASACDTVLARYPAERVGVVVGTSASGTSAIEAVHVPGGEFPFDYHRSYSFGSVATMTQQLLGLAGPCYSVNTACASGAHAVISAARLIHGGLCDAVVVGAVDALCLITYHGFRGLGVLDERICRPFDGDRAGLNLGEGASALVLCREDVTDCGLVLAGYGASADAHHMTAPDPRGGGAAIAIRQAMDRAGIGPADVGYVNLHGTGTPLNDASEALAVHQALGADVPCSSTKGGTGHLLGAAAGVEAAVTLTALQCGRLPGNTNLGALDPEIGIHVLDASMDVPGIRHAVSNSFAFGGANAALLLGISR